MALGHLSLVLSLLIVHHRVRCKTGLENGNDLMSFVGGCLALLLSEGCSVSCADPSHLPHSVPTSNRRDSRSRRIILPISPRRSEEHTSELQSLRHLVCRLLLEKKKKNRAVIW